MTEERKHCGCLMDESCASCHFELSALEAARGEMMQERDAVIAFLQVCEHVTTVEVLRKKRPDYNEEAGRIVVAGIHLMLQYAQDAIKRGVHRR